MMAAEIGCEGAPRLECMEARGKGLSDKDLQVWCSRPLLVRQTV